MTVPAPDRFSAAFGVHRGRVATFDEQVGSGTIEAEGSAVWDFHCTSIADASRTIDPGAPVTFRVAPGPTGLEAVAVAEVLPTAP